MGLLMCFRAADWRKPGLDGRAAMARAGLLFLALFVLFELAHPAADLLSRGGHHHGVARDAPAPGPSSGEDPAAESHGPFLLVSSSSPIPTPVRRARVPGDYPPEYPYLPVPSPVPICG